MRFSIVLAALLLAGCATAPQPAPQARPAPLPPQPRPATGSLVGLAAGDLVQRFGAPALQVREGAGVKLQWRSQRCVLDAYLYPPAGAAGAERVTHVDARLRSGAATDQAGCIAALGAR